MPRGEKRAGGRPKGSKNKNTAAKMLAKEQARELLRQMVTAELGPLTEAQIAKAKGVKYLVGRAKQGGKFKHLTAEQVQNILAGQDSEFELLELWEKLPDTAAYADLMNRALDKPIEQVQADVKHDGTLVFKWQK